MKKTLILIAVLALAGFGLWRWFMFRGREEHNHVTQLVEPAGLTWLDTGLTEQERSLWHHLPEGSELVPISVLEALTSPMTGKPFLHSLADYGFLTESPDPHILPVGWSTDIREIAGQKVPFIGINCSACHSGELRYNGHVVRIDGAPNLFALEQFFVDLRASASSVRTNPAAGFHFVRDVVRLNNMEEEKSHFLALSPKALNFLNSVNEANGLDAKEKALRDAIGGSLNLGLEAKVKTLRDTIGGSISSGLRALTNRLAGVEKGPPKPEFSAEDESSAKEIIGVIDGAVGFIHRRLAALEILGDAIDHGVKLGPGRGDSFGIIRKLLFPFDNIRLDAPVSTPHLFGFGKYEWIHWDGNTKSVMQRNIAQAIALGADYNPSTHETTALPHNLFQLESVGRKIKAPAWPENIFGAIDRARAARGKALFVQQRCAECHGAEKVYSLAEVGTSPVRTTNFAIPLAGKSFPGVLADFAAVAETVLFKQHEVSPEKAREYEPGTPEWRSTGGYVARSLAGIWATAPFLHNGSVPTIHDLLLPRAKRLKQFPVGHRDFDPVKLGFTTDVAKPGFVLDTTQEGNSNQGHEFGTTLSETERMDLIEYLKTL